MLLAAYHPQFYSLDRLMAKEIRQCVIFQDSELQVALSKVLVLYNKVPPNNDHWIIELPLQLRIGKIRGIALITLLLAVQRSGDTLGPESSVCTYLYRGVLGAALRRFRRGSSSGARFESTSLVHPHPLHFVSSSQSVHGMQIKRRRHAPHRFDSITKLQAFANLFPTLPNSRRLDARTIPTTVLSRVTHGRLSFCINIRPVRAI